MLFDPALLIFTIPLFFSFLLGGLAFVGLFDLEALDFDLDVDTDLDLDADVGADVDAGADVNGGVEGGSGGVLTLLGLGFIPLSLYLVLVCFVFGWTGLALVSLVGTSVAAVVGSGVVTSLVLAVPALVGALIVTAPLSRLLQPLFQDYGKATGARELIGSVAVLSTGRVSKTFGSASVRVPGRGRIEVNVRADPEDVSDVGYGDHVLIYDYDTDNNVYLVAQYDEGDVT